MELCIQCMATYTWVTLQHEVWLQDWSTPNFFLSNCKLASIKQWVNFGNGQLIQRYKIAYPFYFSGIVIDSSYQVQKILSHTVDLLDAVSSASSDRLGT